MVLHDFIEDPVNPLAVVHLLRYAALKSATASAHHGRQNRPAQRIFNVNEHGVHTCPLSRTYWFMSEAPWLELKVNQVRRC